MAGSPLKRARKQGVLSPTTALSLSHTCRASSELPPRWRHFSTAEKIKHLLGLDRCEILSWPLDRLWLSIKAHPHVFRICAKAMLHGTLGREVARERERAEALKKLVRDLPGDEYGENRRVVRNCLNGTKIRSDRTGI